MLKILPILTQCCTLSIASLLIIDSDRLYKPRSTLSALALSRKHTLIYYTFS